ncbi:MULTISPECIES: GNAT family N-acetyltransferase [Bacillus]|uniref:GNAT family N-acetyltransferase n=1 Tax=Bacillus TaxID=1386 RepID=UPI00032E54F3|nr:acetyltransferase [Bacillus cereus BAG2O-3]EOQ13717.1 acetyltransferase [Bacillus cereus B5-2]EOQ33439.1 acetyltransferase [Bacillus cereus BAG3O-1]MBJ8115105.1 GNAT family N-acetyltransferase [Bacillus cereus]PFW86334.1 N-acetyltransferase [Bacillus sp. AFS075960]RFB14060.1 GNAT family N-acetyltransferase [Bacillus sp. OE]RFB27119.1 GNAT family N-acetyltransferase [Bacillus sp. LB(2018)]RFB48011.1 GNAT family N-acetyltransferase [Bacillus sp. dmp10]HDR8172796.1 GNAT family N-acetyltrans
MKIRKAVLREANELSELALHSKATWNYSEEFILACKEDLTITEEYIKNNFVYVLENDNTKIGFFSFLRNDKALDFLYIHPRYKGKGYGKILWEYVIEKANELGLKSFTIDSDPNAKGYYLKMGAKLIGETPSTVLKDRLLPLLQYDV